MGSLSGKSILFIAPQFFGYDDVIEAELLSRGANVSRLIDRPFHNSLLKVASKIFPAFMRFVLHWYYLCRIEQLSRKFDFVLIVNGQTVSKKTIRMLKSENPDAVFILYMWDSLKNRKINKEVLNLYHYKFSFDRVSVENYGFRFRPLFYALNDDCYPPNSSSKICASFVGTAHSDRYQIIKKIAPQFHDTDCYWYMYLQAKWVFWWCKLINRGFSSASINEFQFTPLAKSQVSNVFDRSEVIVDIEHPSQTGLTIRTFDVLRSGKKLVTTNPDVVNYDFYKFGNIHLVDRSDPIIPQDFIDKKFNPYPSDILYKYSIVGWVDEILSYVSK